MANNCEPRRADVDEIELVGGLEKHLLEVDAPITSPTSSVSKHHE
ncbi:hypothetical protein [Cryobacterium sp. Y11]|nr:hypothetical protein [Cryobacterium sp. Y11]